MASLGPDHVMQIGNVHGKATVKRAGLTLCKSVSGGKRSLRGISFE